MMVTKRACACWMEFFFYLSCLPYTGDLVAQFGVFTFPFSSLSVISPSQVVSQLDLVLLNHCVHNFLEKKGFSNYDTATMYTLDIQVVCSNSTFIHLLEPCVGYPHSIRTQENTTKRKTHLTLIC